MIRRTFLAAALIAILGFCGFRTARRGARGGRGGGGGFPGGFDMQAVDKSESIAKELKLTPAPRRPKLEAHHGRSPEADRAAHAAV